MRTKILSVIIFTFFGFLFIGLFYIQIIHGPAYLEKSTSNRIRLEALEAPRGRIFDRNGSLLVANRISFDVAVIPQELQDEESTFSLLSDILDIPAESLKKEYSAGKHAPFAPTVVRADIDKQSAIRLEEARLDLAGCVLETRPQRDYLYGQVGAHIFGHMGLINKEELLRLKKYGYQREDLIGRAGLEKTFGNYLKGREGGMQIEVDNRGRQLRMLGIKEPLAGRDIYLTIDINLQKFIDELMSPHRGAAIVMNPDNGEILSMVSKPGFDPGIFVSRNRSDDVKKLLERDDYPLLNRAISTSYPAGSIFKIVVATAALDSKKVTTRTLLSCGGSYALGKFVFKCWKKTGHGPQGIVIGIKNSCNVFFYQLGRMTGVDKIVEFAHIFGYGRSTGVELPGETAGIMPGRMWKMMTKRSSWYEGDTVNLSIGQGYLLVTPMQVIKMMAVVASGNICRPHLVRRIDVVDIDIPESRPSGISSEALDVVKEGLEKVVMEKGGTGRYAGVPGLVIAGKTGTAQTNRDETHAWFSGFSPVKKPKMCVLVFLEYGGKGGLDASKIASKIFEELHKQGYI